MALGKNEAPAGGAGSTGPVDYTETEFEPSKLHKKVQELVDFIFDHKLMAASVVAMDYDIKKMPLGELSKETLMQAYACLTEIEAVIAKKKPGNLSFLAGRFYTLIPHNFGFSKMSAHIIDNKEKMKAKLELVQSLVDI